MNQSSTQQSEDQFTNKRNNTLINESIYYLNKSKSKWVSVGFSLERKYDPIIKLGGCKYNQKVIFTEDQWNSFLNNQGIMLSFIYSTGFGWQPMRGNGFEIQFVFIKDSRIIKLVQDGGNEIFLAGDTINEVVRLANLIKYRFDLLKDQEFSKYYNILVAGLSIKNGDLIKHVYDIISPILMSSNVCCVLELIHLYPDCLIEDVETFACNEFVKNCIEK